MKLPASRLRVGLQLFTLALAITPGALGQTVADLDPHAHAIASASQPRIRLEWAAMANSQSFTVSRRDTPTEPFATVGAMLPGTTTSFGDMTAEAGRTYEYRITRQPAPGNAIAVGNSYVMAGADVPFRDDPGIVLLVVDSSMASALATELTRLRDDLIADGWTVQREDVAPTLTPTMVRARIQSAHAMSNDRLRAVILLGGVPRAFSGRINPDGHPDHLGAWPADAFYGDVDGEWTDTANLGGAGTFANIPGDGKFDQSSLPSDIELAVGRIDTVDMPAFMPLDATALLRRYLDHDHAYRVGSVQIRQRGYVNDNFGYFSGEAFARGAYRDTQAIFGNEVETGRPFFDALEDPAGGFAFAWGDGGGNPTGAGGVGSTTDFVTRMPRALFVGLFGSYFGDWSYSNNFLRASILGPGTALATIWFARPYAHLHSMGALHSFGDAFVDGANNLGFGYDTGSGARFTHLALLGDPTLRAFVTRAPDAVVATAGSNGIALRWMPSPDMVAGYHVYRSTMGDSSPAARLTMMPVTATSYVDSSVSAGTRYSYRVVAVQRVTTGSGTFFNHSPGIRAEATAVAMSVADAGTALDASAAGRDAAGDARADGAAGDGGTGGMAGCGCGVPGEDPARGSMALLALGLASLVRSRRREFRRRVA